MRTAFVHSRRRGSITLYGLTTFVLAATAWAYLTPIDISVNARGIVRPAGDPIRIVSEVGGRVRRIYVKEGSEIHQGDPLLQLDTRQLLLRQTTLETRIHFTELRIADLQRQLDDATAIEEQSASLDAYDRDVAQRNARAGLEHARSHFARTGSLLQEGLVPRQVYEEARLALAQAETEESRYSSRAAELKRAQAAAHLRDLNASATPLRADLASLYHELEETRIEISRLTILSPTDGQITSLASLHADEILAPGAAIAAIVPRSQSLLIESWLPTSNRTSVNTGQRVRLQTDGFASDQYDAIDGTVFSISPDARFNESLTGAFRVLISPMPHAPGLHLGMTFQVHFITRQERLLWLLFQRIRREFEAD